MDWYALSVRQPWAALILSGRKTVEVRTWPTPRRGPVLLHAGKLADARAEPWALVDGRQLAASAALRGGVVGVVEIADCVEYATAEAFAADAERHRNPAGWFRPPRLFGFVLASARPVRLYNIPGNTAFFRVPGYQPPAA